LACRYAAKGCSLQWPTPMGQKVRDIPRYCAQACIQIEKFFTYFLKSHWTGKILTDFVPIYKKRHFLSVLIVLRVNSRNCASSTSS
jgi:hypothetical protein